MGPVAIWTTNLFVIGDLFSRIQLVTKKNGKIKVKRNVDRELY